MGVVQTSSVSFGAVLSASRTFSPSPTAGNLLLLSVALANAAPGWTGPGGDWTLAPSLETGNFRAWHYWKYADGDETTESVSWSSSGGFGTMVIKELDDAVAGPPIVAENEGNATTVVTSQGTGTAAATAASGVAIAIFAADFFNTVDGSPSYSDGFAELSSNGATSRAGLFFAKKAITATGNYSCTRSCTDTGDEQYGVILLFQGAGAGAAPLAVFANHFRQQGFA